MFTNQKNKEDFRILCDENQNIPLFMQAWWMDAACGDKKWDVLLYKKNDKIIAVWVFHFIKRLGFKIILQPQLTQYNGIWIDYPENYSKSQILSFEKDTMIKLIEQMKTLEFSYIQQNFHHSFTNWLPFYWNDFKQTTRYTYQIKDIENIEKCIQEFKSSKRSHIKKATNIIHTNLNLTGSEFYNQIKENLKKRGSKVTYSKELFLRLYEACRERNQGCIISSYDYQNNFHAALFIVWDENYAYNLISTINPKFRSSGATSLLFLEAIRLMSSKTKIFDFEGSMNEKIEKSFREFGAIQIPYFQITKYNSLSFRILHKLNEWLY